MKFDPKEKQTVNKTIRIDEELVQQVHKIAGERNLSFNKFVIQCIEYAINNLKMEEDENQARGKDAC